MCAKSHNSRVNINWSEGRHSVSVVILLNFLPFGRGRTDLQPGEKDLVAVLPHDEGPDGTDQSLGQVEHDLDQEVQSEGPSYRLAVSHPLVGEGASYGVLLVECANAVLSGGPTAEATGLWVVVSGERHHQHWNDQADGTQDKVQNLQRRDGSLEALIFPPLLKCLAPAAVLRLTPSSKPSLEPGMLAYSLRRVKEITHNSAGKGLEQNTCKSALKLQQLPTFTKHPVWVWTTESKNTAVKCDTGSVLFTQLHNLSNTKSSS